MASAAQLRARRAFVAKYGHGRHNPRFKVSWTTRTHSGGSKVKTKFVDSRGPFEAAEKARSVKMLAGRYENPGEYSYEPVGGGRRTYVKRNPRRNAEDIESAPAHHRRARTHSGGGGKSNTMTIVLIGGVAFLL